ncbi:hypothetical protein N836_03490 [Leptolyngbya sp. Heron Island J]|uniref:hypothetical protein n=1 Tax=Leptolyngbya sp. Heron Island J TaxID=1385935 RepID=UPI0003B95357|nr:hypothetical protein [Leptolyngbya sp. Heron Island J]ESA37311.1 hypothetical protein N836_03490 [Leptolyngbya sp. Heron Island J]
MQRIFLIAILSVTTVAITAISLDYTGIVKMACSQEGCEVIIHQGTFSDNHFRLM